MKKVLIVGDSRKMKGGVSTVIKSMEANPIWKKYNCYWLQCQINKGILWKVMYLAMGLLNSLFRVPLYDIVHFLSMLKLIHLMLLSVILMSMPLYVLNILLIFPGSVVL